MTFVVAAKSSRMVIITLRVTSPTLLVGIGGGDIGHSQPLLWQRVTSPTLTGSVQFNMGLITTSLIYDASSGIRVAVGNWG